MGDETDYAGDYWSAIHEQSRLWQIQKLLAQGFKCLPSEHRHANLPAHDAINRLIELNGMEVARRQMLYERSVKEKSNGEG